jgi:hypothetical protein
MRPTRQSLRRVFKPDCGRESHSASAAEGKAAKQAASSDRRLVYTRTGSPSRPYLSHVPRAAFRAAGKQ